MKTFSKGLIFAIPVTCFVFFYLYISREEIKIASEREQVAGAALASQNEFLYRFQVPGVLEESGSIDESSSEYWWLNSGGRLFLEGGVGKTIQGGNDSEFWRRAYAQSNPNDTDLGSHPQNIFRLLTRTKWQDAREEVYFRIIKINLSQSPNRGESNGVLLMSRYQDSNNLYYIGLRVDGHGVIKKKKAGVYYTMAEAPVFYSEAGYNRDTNPNMIPGQSWIGLRSSAVNLPQGEVRLTLSVDKEGDGNWQEIISVIDEGNYGGDPFTKPGLTGIRSDFLDLEFDNFIIRKI